MSRSYDALPRPATDPATVVKHGSHDGARTATSYREGDRPKAARALVVGGEKGERERLRTLLNEDRGAYQLESFSTAAKALAAARAGAVDCLFVAAELPDLSTAEFLKQLAASNPSRPLPAVIVFGADPHRVGENIRLGAQDSINLATATREDLMRSVAHARERLASIELRQRLDLAERLATLGRLAAGVAHEINNPAAYALANLSQLRERTRLLRAELAKLTETSREPSLAKLGSSLDEIEEMVVDSLEGVNRIATIVGELQQFARSRPHENTWTDLCEVARVAVRLTKNRIRHRCEVRTQLNRTRRFVADQGKLVQIAINLIDNACKAMTGAPEDAVTVSTGVDGDVSWLSIEDNGHGVSEELRSKIFEPFFTTDERRTGTGLGLTLSREYAERHRGSLDFEPRAGGGSRFVLRVPTDTGLSVPVNRAPRPSGHRSEAHTRVLVVDDEPAVLRAYRRVLSPTYAVTLVNNGREALDRIHDGADFDAVICDINMPQMGGVDFYRQLELNHPELARRVVFCSGGVFGEDAREFIESTRNPVLHKPLEPQALLDALSGFLDRRHPA